ncbi:dehydrogenase [Clostridia bacterium]|nr:dehydrogenase [Clostridia bacterium]
MEKKVAMLSKWHVHASDYASQVRKYGVPIACVYDEDASRGAAWADELGVDFEQDLDHMLTREDVSAVICCAATTAHKDVLIKVANMGKDIFTEKAMAPTVAECDAISEAVSRNGVLFLISTPDNGKPHILYAKKVIEDGLIGEITQLRIRVGHDGSSRGWLPEYWYDEKMSAGGAMMDLGCHPMYEASFLLGEPKRVASIYTDWMNRGTEDCAVSVFEFKNKATAIIESSLVTYSSPPAFELYGTKGTLILRGDELEMTCDRLKGITRKYVKVTDLPDGRDTTINLFLDAVTKGEPIPYGVNEGRALTRLLEGAYTAHRSNSVYVYD